MYGGKKDAEKVANELALKPARQAGRRTASAVLPSRPWRQLRTDGALAG